MVGERSFHVPERLLHVAQPRMGAAEVRVVDRGRPLAQEVLDQFPVDILITDLRVPEMGGLQLLKRASYIDLLLAESKRAGVVSAGEQQMLQRVFKFHDKTVREIMIPRTDIIITGATNE